MKRIREKIRAIVYVNNEPVRLVFNGELSSDDSDELLDAIHGVEELPVSTARIETFKDFGSSYTVMNLDSKRPTQLHTKIGSLFSDTKTIRLQNARTFGDIVKSIGTQVASRN